MNSADVAPALVIIVLTLTLGAIFVLRGPFGRALADRLMGRTGAAEGRGAIEQLRAEVEALRGELGAVQERLDFTERLLTRHADAGAIKPGA